MDGVLNEIFGLFEEYGNSDYLGEKVSKTTHSIQVGKLAEKSGAPVEVSLQLCTQPH